MLQNHCKMIYRFDFIEIGFKFVLISLKFVLMVQIYCNRRLEKVRNLVRSIFGLITPLYI